MNSCIKKKNCWVCGELFVPFRTFDKTCSYECAKRYEESKVKKPKKPARIKPISNKRQDQLKIYKRMRKRYLEKTPKCERCGSPATEIHHKAGRTNDLLNDVQHFMAICRKCHRWVHDNPKDARENNWLL